jgi:hypothetical protein
LKPCLFKDSLLMPSEQLLFDIDPYRYFTQF